MDHDQIRELWNRCTLGTTSLENAQRAFAAAVRNAALDEAAGVALAYDGSTSIVNHRILALKTPAVADPQPGAKE